MSSADLLHRNLVRLRHLAKKDGLISSADLDDFALRLLEIDAPVTDSPGIGRGPYPDAFDASSCVLTNRQAVRHL